MGSYLNNELSKKFEILTTFINTKGDSDYYQNKKLDITDYNGVRETFAGFKPDVVVHTAAISNQKKADKLPADIVRKINVEGTENIAGLCREYGARLLFLSTDLVYDGNQGSMLTENAKLNPASLYAETKLEAEEKIQSKAGDYVILRSALMYGLVNRPEDNYFQFMYESLKNEQTVRLFYDQFRTPLWLGDAARMIKEIIDFVEIRRTFNFGGLERLSRWDMGEILCSIAGLDKDLLVKRSMYDIDGLPKVPDVSMNTDSLQAYGIKAGKYEERVEQILREL